MAECVELGLHAVAMSRASGLWSAMKIVTPVADGSGTVTLPVLDTDPILPTVEIDGRRWVSHPSAKFLGQRMLDVEREFREIRLPLAHRYGVDNGLNRVSIDPPDAWIGLVATGFTYYEMLDALRRLGLDGPRRARGRRGARAAAPYAGAVRRRTRPHLRSRARRDRGRRGEEPDARMADQGRALRPRPPPARGRQDPRGRADTDAVVGAPRRRRHHARSARAPHADDSATAWRPKPPPERDADADPARRSTAPRSSAPAARTTGAPRCPRARWSAPARAATGCRC